MYKYIVRTTRCFFFAIAIVLCLAAKSAAFTLKFPPFEETLSGGTKKPVPVEAGASLKGRVDSAHGSGTLGTVELDFTVKIGGENYEIKGTVEAQSFSVTWTNPTQKILLPAGKTCELSGIYRVTFKDIGLSLDGTSEVVAMAQSLKPESITVAGNSINTTITSSASEELTLIPVVSLNIKSVIVNASIKDEANNKLYSDSLPAKTAGQKKFNVTKTQSSTVVIDKVDTVFYEYNLSVESELVISLNEIVVGKSEGAQAAPGLHSKAMRMQTAGEDDLVAYSVLEGDIQWYNQDGQIPAATGDVLPAELAEALDEIYAAITTEEGQAAESNQVLIPNNPPSLEKATVVASPEPPTVASTLRAAPEGWQDADGDAEGYLYQWFNQDGIIDGETNDTLSAKFVRGDSIFVLVVPFDGTVYGAPVKSSPIVIKNTPPSLTEANVEVSTQKPTRASILTAIPAGWSDADGDAANYEYEWFNQDGALIGTDVTYNEKDVILDGETTMNMATPFPLPKGTPLNIELLGIQTGEVTIHSPGGNEVQLTMPEIEGAVAKGGLETQFDEVGEYKIDELYKLIIKSPPGALFKIENPVKASFSWKYDNAEPGKRTLVYETKVKNINAQITGSLEGEVDIPKPESNFVLNVKLTESVPAGGSIEATIKSQAGFYKKSAIEISGIALTGPTLTGRNFKAGDKLYVKVTPFDGIDRGASVKSSEILILNTPPSIDSVTIASDTTPVTVVSKLEAKVEGWQDVDEDAETIQYQWYTQSGKIPDATEATLQSSFNKGDQVYVVVIPTDGKENGEAQASNKLLIVNTEPTGPKVEIRPTQPAEDDELTCEFIEPSTDADGDDISYNIKWYKNNKEQKDLADKQTIEAQYTVAGEKWRCKVVATDGEANSSTASSKTVTIKEVKKNTPPNIDGVDIQPSLAYVGDILTAVPKGWTDAEGNKESYRYQWQIQSEGEWSDVGTDATFDTSKVADASTIKVIVIPYDGEDEGTPETASVTLGGIVANNDGSVVARIPPNTVQRTDVRVVLATSTDDEQVKQAGENSVGYYASAGDVWQLNVYDAEGNQIYDAVAEDATVTVKLYYSGDVPELLLVDLSKENPIYQKAEATVDADNNYVQATLAWQTAFALGKSDSPADPWDINGDGKVDIGDLVSVGRSFGENIITSPENNPDVNRDRTVDISDLVIVGTHFGEEVAPRAAR